MVVVRDGIWSEGLEEGKRVGDEEDGGVVKVGFGLPGSPLVGLVSWGRRLVGSAGRAREREKALLLFF